MLKVTNISCGYDDNLVIKDMSFSLSEGESLCIIGSNGCGKTTLLKAISGLLPYSGSITLNDSEIKNTKPSEIGKTVAMLSQQSAVYFSYSVFDTVMLGRYVMLPKGVFTRPDKSHADYVMYCLEKVGIAELKDRDIQTLSGGQLQKVLLARALAQEPQIILLDEPSNHLDLKSQMELFGFLKEWTRDKKHSVIGVLHDVNLALNFFEHGLFMKNGEIVFNSRHSEATREDLFSTYSFDVVEYLTELNKPMERLNVSK